MADTVHFDLVSPERQLASATATEVQLPGIEGDMTAMPDHAPLITSLRPGFVRIAGPDGAHDYAVTGGFAEITGTSVTVLAEQAFPRESASRGAIETALGEAREKLAAAPAEHRDAVETFVADLVALLDAMD
ncbi:MAG: F0F1 ATP synthase subunit epsilon [Rhodobacteraceae bacterium]|nr:F0F1 ATP synthase subunit epsilon [Paracoccaceae bacterium]